MRPMDFDLSQIKRFLRDDALENGKMIVRENLLNFEYARILNYWLINCQNKLLSEMVI
jgi:hypothetical protein